MKLQPKDKMKVKKEKKERNVTLDDILKMVDRDNRCANAALAISILSVLLIVACALFKIFRPV